MSKFNSRTIYCGNLIRWCDGRKILYKDNVLLLYDKENDVFYSYLDTFNLFLSRDLDNLNRNQLEIIKEKIARYTYRYGYSESEDEIVVDDSSVRAFIQNEGKMDRR